MFESFGFDFDTGKNTSGNTVGTTTKTASKEQTAVKVWNDCKDKDGNVRHTLFIQMLSKEDSFSEEQAKKLFALWEQNCIIKLNKDGTWGKI